MDAEQWRDVVGYEGWYSVSDLGRVRRDRAARRTHAGRILKSWLTDKGYVSVGLSHGTHASLRFHFVHTLVTTAFIGPKPAEAIGVNHLNGVKTDNRPENLEWATPAQNSAHAVTMGFMSECGRHTNHRRGDEHPMRLRPDRVPRGEHNGMAKLDENSVRDILTSPLSAKDLASKYGVGSSLIYQVRSRVIWRHVVVS